MDYQHLKEVFLDQQTEFQQLRIEVVRHIDLEPHLKSKSYVSIISGVRRCGKSTLLKQIRMCLPPEANILYLRLDDPRLALFQQEDFNTVYKIWLEEVKSTAGENYIFIDEIQNVDGWERWADYFSQRPLTKVFITGSNSRLLSSELSTFLTGRQLPLRLTPFSFEELVNYDPELKAYSKDLTSSPEVRAGFQKQFNEFTKFGGFPRAFLDKNLAILPELYDDILRRDILPRAKRANPESIIRLSQILVSESGRLFNKSNVASDIGVAGPQTVSRYCDFFLDAFLFKEIKSFSRSVRKQLRSLAKFYCVDHALSKAAGFRRSDSDYLDLEMMVLNELTRRGRDLYYWNSKDSLEVDFIEVEGIRPVSAFQVSERIENAKTKDRELRALIAANKELGISELKIITVDTTDEFVSNGIKVSVIPFVTWALSGNSPA